MPQIFLFLLSIKKDSGRNNGTPAHISVPLIRVLKVIYSNICGKASKVHLADKDAIADRNVVPGARPQLCIPLSLSFMQIHRQFFSPPSPLSRFSFLISPLRLSPQISFLSFFYLPTFNSLPHHAFLCPYSLLHISFHISPSPTPSFLRHPDFMVI